MARSLAEVIYEQNRDSKLTRDESVEIVKMVIKGIQEMLLKDEEVKLTGLGSFKTHETKPRKYDINGYSGVSEVKRKVKFKLYNAFLQALN